VKRIVWNVDCCGKVCFHLEEVSAAKTELTVFHHVTYLFFNQATKFAQILVSNEISNLGWGKAENCVNSQMERHVIT
jgi:hypothetical protein